MEEVFSPSMTPAKISRDLSSRVPANKWGNVGTLLNSSRENLHGLAAAGGAGASTLDDASDSAISSDDSEASNDLHDRIGGPPFQTGDEDPPGNDNDNTINQDTKPSKDDSAKINPPEKPRVSSTTRLLRQLVPWTEPNKKAQEVGRASVADILIFRKAITFMDDHYPFSYSFGEASSRELCCKSAVRTFRRLAEGDSHVPFEAIAVLAITNDGYLDSKKQEELKRLFLPDADGEVSQRNFVQSCDDVYKRLRYFRASVANSSLIDKFLEEVLSGFFVFALVLCELAVLGYNPYPILVSVSALIVSSTFAIKVSAANYFEVSQGLLETIVPTTIQQTVRSCACACACACVNL